MTKVEIYGVALMVLAFIVRSLAKFLVLKCVRRTATLGFVGYMINSIAVLVLWLLYFAAHLAFLFGLVLVGIEWFNKR